MPSAWLLAKSLSIARFLPSPKAHMSHDTFNQLAAEWRDKRNAINATLEGMNRNNDACIASLDEALSLIAKASISTSPIWVENECLKR